jgi:prepilin-type N-terminal cleavage/methylation domain-containing protein
MKRTAFTMVELIMTIIIMGILAGGTYISLAQLYTKSAKSKAISELSFDSTLIANQISALLAYRVPATVIGYDSETGNFESIYTLSSSYKILEWIGTDFERYKAGKYSGFVDFEKSDKNENMIFSPNTSEINGSALIFAGSFDEGGVIYGDDFNNSFGWHGNDSNKTFEINSTSTGNELGLLTHPSKIYEKYYLLKSAYAIAKHDDNLSNCDSVKDSNITASDNTLLLFYDYYPWKGETFCKDASVTILSNEVKGFEVDFVNENLQFNLTLEREIRKKGKDLKIQISKQKVVF